MHSVLHFKSQQTIPHNNSACPPQPVYDHPTTTKRPNSTTHCRYMGTRNVLFVYEQQAGYTACARGATTDAYPCYPTEQHEVPKYMLPFHASFFKSTAFSVFRAAGDSMETLRPVGGRACESKTLFVLLQEFADVTRCHLCKAAAVCIATCFVLVSCFTVLCF